MNGDTASKKRANVNEGYWTHVAWYFAVVGLILLSGYHITREADPAEVPQKEQGVSTTLADAMGLTAAPSVTGEAADEALLAEPSVGPTGHDQPEAPPALRIRHPFAPGDAADTSRVFLIGLYDSFVRADFDQPVEPDSASPETSDASGLGVLGDPDQPIDRVGAAEGHTLAGTERSIAGDSMGNFRRTERDLGEKLPPDTAQTGKGTISLPSLEEAEDHAFIVDGAVPDMDQPDTRVASRMAETPGNSHSMALAPSLSQGAGPRIDGRNQFVYQLASQPPYGTTFDRHRPNMDPLAVSVPVNPGDFSEGPCYDPTYDPIEQMQVYEGKRLNATRRPLVELGRPWYQLGPLSDPLTIFGRHNPMSQQFIIFGDSRIGAASNQGVNEYSSLIARQTNLFFDYKVTSTERFNMFVSPSTRGINSTRYEFDNHDYFSEFNFNIINGFFEGDLGSIWGGIANQTMPFDLPVAIGVMPLLFQNGVWMEDNVLGFAATMPARNIPAWNVSNMDLTFFAGYDNVTSPAFANVKDVARIYGMAGFVEAWNGYLELNYAFLDDRQDLGDRSYHNIGIGYSRRWGRLFSNSTRVIVNAGQDTGAAPGTADGVLLLSENSLITSSPSNIVPYLNMFAGFDQPQSAARAAQAGGVLRNTGILFESDNLTNYPTLDATANNTFGAALGVNLLSNSFNQQLVLETAMLGVMDEAIHRHAAAAQYGFGARYQLPLTHSVLLRADAMYGCLIDSSDIHGVRVEIRRKF